MTVETGNMGDLTVDFETYGWFPAHLPGEATDSDSDEEE